MTEAERSQALAIIDRFNITDYELMLLYKLQDSRITANAFNVSHQRVIEILDSFCIKPNSAGYRYLLKAIQIAYHRPSLLNRSVTTYLYPNVGRFFKVSGHAVEVSIKRAIEYAFENAPMELFAKFFPNIFCPTNTVFISAITVYLRSQDGLDLI